MEDCVFVRRSCPPMADWSSPGSADRLIGFCGKSGRLSGLFCRWQGGRFPESSPAQRGSGISKWGMKLMGKKHKNKNCPAQRDSGMSILKKSPYSPLAVRLVPQGGDPYRPLVFKNSPAQRDSKISNLGVLGILRSLGILGGNTKKENRPAQRDSGMSILKTSPYRPYLLAVRLVPQSGDPYRPLDFKNRPPQRDSKMSNGRLSGVFCRWQGGRLPETSPAQRDSKNSNLVVARWE